MKIINLRKGDKLKYVKSAVMAGACEGQISIIHSAKNEDISISGGVYGIPINGLCENYKFIKEDGTLEDITKGLGYTDFIVRAKNLALACYKIGIGQPYSIDLPKEYLNELMQDTLFQICSLDDSAAITPEKSHKNWMDRKIRYGWIYGETENLEKKTHPNLIPFNSLSEIEKK